MDQEITLKRLRYRSCHRGCKETDLVLGNFAESNLNGLKPAEITVYEQFLDEDDANIWSWLTEKSSPPQEYVELLAMMKVASC